MVAMNYFLIPERSLVTCIFLRNYLVEFRTNAEPVGCCGKPVTTIILSRLCCVAVYND
jgi:hypothetical protein